MIPHIQRFDFLSQHGRHHIGDALPLRHSWRGGTTAAGLSIFGAILLISAVSGAFSGEIAFGLGLVAVSFVFFVLAVRSKKARLDVHVSRDKVRVETEKGRIEAPLSHFQLVGFCRHQSDDPSRLTYFVALLHVRDPRGDVLLHLSPRANEWEEELAKYSELLGVEGQLQRRDDWELARTQ